MIEAYFDKIETQIAQKLSSATNKVYLAVAWFTNETLYEKILKCCQSDVTVCVVIMNDYINRNEYGLDFSKFIEAGGKLYFSKEKKMHNKFCIIDDIVITGSYNWTYYAENLNYENIIITDDSQITNKYLEEFEIIIASSIRITNYEPLELSKMSDTEMYEDYSYLCNDLILKGQDYKDKIRTLNKEKNINIKIEESECHNEYDSKGFPILKKILNPPHLEYRLINLSIGSIPIGRPNAGRKYVHAQYTSNNIWEEDGWVDIFDSDYVNDVQQYFYIYEGGIIGDGNLRPAIPEKLYNPNRYGFRLVTYTFYKFGKYGNKRHKLGYNNRIIVNRNGEPYEFDRFETLIRYDKETNRYVEFNSMTELCHMIIQSLFTPNEADDLDSIYERIRYQSRRNGVFKATIDDFHSICIAEGTGMSNPTISIDNIKDWIINNPNGFWLYNENGNTLSYAYGIFSNSITYYPNSVHRCSQNNIDGEWFLLLRLKASHINSNEDKFGVLLKKIREDLIQQGKKGIIHYCTQSKTRYFEELGFEKIKPSYSQDTSSLNQMILKL